MTFLALLATVLIVGPIDDPSSKLDNPKTAIKTLLDQASEVYKTQTKAYQACKTSAEQADALDHAKLVFNDWSSVIDDVEVSFESRLLDVVKDKNSDTYYAVLEQGKDLQKFTKPGSVTIAVRKFYIEVTKEQSQSLKIGSRLTITGRLSTTLLYSIDMQGVARGANANASRLDSPPGAIICLFMFNYSPSVFSRKSTEYHIRPEDFITVTLEDAQIQFGTKKP